MLHICGVSETFGEWYQKTNKTEDTNKLTLLAFKNNRHPSQHTAGNVHKASGGNPRTCDSCSAFADSFQKLYERCQPCVVKDVDYFKGQ
jgi:hypothetical protein